MNQHRIGIVHSMRLRLTVLIAAALGFIMASTARADDRRFVYTDESRHFPPVGDLEIEQGFTFLSQTREDGHFNRLDIKHELEYGLSENVQVAVDLAEWHYQSDAEGHETVYDASAAEVRFRFLDPVKDFVGLGYKVELGIGREQLEWENRLIIDKIIDKWEISYNLLLEAEWEGEGYFKYDEHGGELTNLVGVSYEVNPSIFVGAEMMYEIPLPDWKSGEKHNLFFGPNFSYRGHNWAITTTVLFLLDGGADEAKFQIRSVFEIDF